MIVGVGTGRCGTTSLARLLDAQRGLRVTHERYQWRVPWNGPAEWADRLIREAGGDVAFYWLPLLEYIWGEAPETKVICMRRDRAETVRSYMRWTEGRNHWMDHEGEQWDRCRWDHAYPSYEAASKEEALGMYWDEYYDRAEALQAGKPERFRIFELGAMNSRTGVREILDFAGVPRGAQRLNAGIRENAQ